MYFRLRGYYIREHIIYLRRSEKIMSKNKGLEIDWKFFAVAYQPGNGEAGVQIMLACDRAIHSFESYLHLPDA